MGRRGQLTGLLVAALTGLAVVTHGEIRSVVIWLLGSVAVLAALGIVNVDVVVSNLWLIASRNFRQKVLDNRWRLTVTQSADQIRHNPRGKSETIPGSIVISLHAPYRTYIQANAGDNPIYEAWWQFHLVSNGKTCDVVPVAGPQLGKVSVHFPRDFRDAATGLQPERMGRHAIRCTVTGGSQPPKHELRKEFAVTDAGLVLTRRERLKQRRRRLVVGVARLFVDLRIQAPSRQR